MVTKSNELVRIYFPIPRECRFQMRNPLVLKEQLSVIELVKRDSPEEKLDDYLDRSAQVENVIMHQDLILTKSRFKVIIRFLTTRERFLVLVTYVLTLTINAIMIVEMSESNDATYRWVGSTFRISCSGGGRVEVPFASALLTFSRLDCF